MNISPEEIDQILSQFLVDTSEPETGNISHTTQDEPFVLDVDQEASLDEEIVNTVSRPIVESAPLATAPAAVNSIANQFVPAVQPGGVSHDAGAFLVDGLWFYPVFTDAQPTAHDVTWPTSTQVTDVTPASTSTVAEAPVENPDASSTSNKRKLYEMEEFTDPIEEKKRKAAVNANNHRQKIKKIIQDLKREIASLKAENERLRPLEVLVNDLLDLLPQELYQLA